MPSLLSCLMRRRFGCVPARSMTISSVPSSLPLDTTMTSFTEIPESFCA